MSACRTVASETCAMSGCACRPMCGCRRLVAG